MDRVAYEELLRIARHRRTTTYGDLARVLGYNPSRPYSHRQRIALLLGEISEREHHFGRPMLSAVVVNKETGRPGKGFFKLASDLGLYSGSSEEQEDEFFTSELNRVYAAWKTQR